MHVQAFILHSCGLTDGVYFQAARIPEGWTCDPGYLQRFFRPGTGRRDMAQYYGFNGVHYLFWRTVLRWGFDVGLYVRDHKAYDLP